MRQALAAAGIDLISDCHVNDARWLPADADAPSAPVAAKKTTPSHEAPSRVAPTPAAAPTPTPKKEISPDDFFALSCNPTTHKSAASTPAPAAPKFSSAEDTGKRKLMQDTEGGSSAARAWPSA